MVVSSIDQGCAGLIDENDYQIGMRRLERIINQNQSCESTDNNPINQCKLCGYVWNTGGNDEKPKICPLCRSTLWDCEEARKVKCLRCGYIWLTKKNPSKCPSCGSKRWNKETLAIICKKCGMRWEDKVKDGIPISCPVCGDLESDEYKVGRIRKESLKDVTDRRKRSIPLDEKILKEMWDTEGDLYRSVLLRKHGLTPEQADIIVRFDHDESVPEIASSMGISVSEVMDSVIQYMKLCESLGVKSWN